jgi:D-glycero-alpha-D-manno-heptose-7-phosphate kinase
MNSNNSRRTVRARAPLRLGLGGGGTDLSPYCDLHGGVALNCTIDRYAYAFITPRSDQKLVLGAQDLETEEIHDLIPDIDVTAGLKLHRGVYNRIVKEFCGGEPLPITLSTTVDAPPGSGLGSSSALSVALVEAFRGYLDLPLGRYDVAHLAFEIERLELGLAGGKQDQYAAAFGGVNFIEFLSENRVIVNPLRLTESVLNEFETSLVICFTGVSRSSDSIISQQIAGIRNDPNTLKALHQLKADAIAMKKALLAGDVSGMAEILMRSWVAKKETSKMIATTQINDLFAIALAHGALSGKVSGAGGGGFMMFLVTPDNRLRVIQALNASGGMASPVHLTSKGSETWTVPYSRGLDSG